eukprot:4424862-Amphidinium_carterae.1
MFVTHARVCAIAVICALSLLAGVWSRGRFHISSLVLAVAPPNNTLPLVANRVEVARGNETQLVAHNRTSGRRKQTMPADETLLFFLHIPKTGGTTIEELGMRYGIHWARKGSWRVKKRTACSLWHLPPSFLPADSQLRKLYGSCSAPWVRDDQSKVLKRTLDTGQRCATFCIMRNPYERAMSEFNFKLRLEGQSLADWMFPNQNVVANCTPAYLNVYLQHMFRSYHRK